MQATQLGVIWSAPLNPAGFSADALKSAASTDGGHSVAGDTVCKKELPALPWL